MRTNLLPLPLLLGGLCQAAEPAPEFKDWAQAACVKAAKLGEVVYERRDGSSERFAKFDWQQVECIKKVDTSGKAPTGVVDYIFALRRTDFVATAEAAQRQPASTGLGTAGYRLYYRAIEGRWQPVAYRPLGSSYTVIQTADSRSEPLRMFNDAAAARSLGAVPTRAMAPLLNIAANTACSPAKDVDVVCEYRQ